MVEFDDVDWLVVHCSATPPHMDIGEDWIRGEHVKKGWDDIGYHVVIRRNGVREFGRPLDVRGAHVKGYNSNSIGICLIGGVDNYNNPEDNFTPSQKESLLITLDAMHLLFPSARVRGHRDFPDVAKACPCFSVRSFLNSSYRGYLAG